jgi:hypothetical protein
VLRSVIFYTHLTEGANGSKVRIKRVTDCNSEVTASECGGGTKVWTKQLALTVFEFDVHGTVHR